MIPHEKEEGLLREMLDSRAEVQKIQGEPGYPFASKSKKGLNEKMAGTC